MSWITRLQKYLLKGYKPSTITPSDEFGKHGVKIGYKLEPTPMINTLSSEYQLDFLMQYLEDEEGYSVHWLKGEKSITAFLGIHRHAHQYWGGWTWLENIAKEGGYDLNNKSDLKDLTFHIQINHDRVYRSMARDFYKKEFYNPLRLNLFGKFSGVVAFSSATNAGFGNFSDFLQLTLNHNGGNLVEDGYAGNNTFAELERQRSKGLSDKYLATELTDYFEIHYANLMQINPNHYLQFKVGYAGRIKRLRDMIEKNI